MGVITIKKIFSFATSIISVFIIIFYFSLNSNAQNNNSKLYSKDEGVLSIMYHRFNESKYPSTNIQMDIFEKQIELIMSSKFDFINPKEFEKNFNLPKNQK